MHYDRGASSLWLLAITLAIFVVVSVVLFSLESPPVFLDRLRTQVLFIFEGQ
jgi:hypothetical protein